VVAARREEGRRRGTIQSWESLFRWGGRQAKRFPRQNLAFKGDHKRSSQGKPLVAKAESGYIGLSCSESVGRPVLASLGPGVTIRRGAHRYDGLRRCASEVCISQFRFTGKERDSESGNDYFGARYYASTIGRFLSPDWSDEHDPVPYADFEDPQSFNLYSYVENNPLGSVDANGHTHQDCKTSTTSTTDSSGNISMTVSMHCVDVPDWWNFWTNSSNAYNNFKNWVNSNVEAHRPPPHPANRYLTAEDILGAPSIAGVGTQLIEKSRLKYILEGDGPGTKGGGHRPGLGKSGKSEFPAGWSDDKIADAIADVATRPGLKQTIQGSDTVIEGP
jgi:RHS repeat-associated protein